MLPILALLLTGALAAPASPLDPIPDPEPECPRARWLIPRLDVHFMSDKPGIPGMGDWPLGSGFNSTIDFDVQFGNATAVCKGAWPKGKLDQGTYRCEIVGADGTGEEEVSFKMAGWRETGEKTPEASFRLNVVRSEVGSGKQFDGSTNITANNPAEPTSYLTCILGAPFDGIRCNLHSYMSVRDKDLVIDAQATC
ncbi:hypothetical protein BDV95DRAFT_368989 [Massariosphaeria phaeospora]|uniref:Ig-like domain-containing protein n=1 Tax=Massariosphaeria phaeospora TaxID=100035 RepID=A0A7C8I861_9PLEO|nr:hypothetical protein BDV95DRAFT_368989 [Massariosphaeria phaeospora]